MLKQPPAPKPRIHPDLANDYCDKKSPICIQRLTATRTRPEAAEVPRNLVEEVRLVPEDGQLEIELRDDLAAILSFAQKAIPAPGAPG